VYYISIYLFILCPAARVLVSPDKRRVWCRAGLPKS